MKNWILLILLLGAVASASQAQVVIRDRVIVSAPVAASTSSAGCSGPVLGHLVYKPGGEDGPGLTRSYGGALDATLTVYTSCGGATAQTSASAASAFTLTGTQPYIWAPTVQEYKYAPTPDAEILRVPLRRGESVDSVAYNAAGTRRGRIYLPVGARAGTDAGNWIFGCNALSCLDEPPGAVLTTHTVVEGFAAAMAPLDWPAEVACGTTTPLPVLGALADGSEGYIGATYPMDVTLAAEGGALEADGQLAGSGETLVTTFETLASGGLSFIAPTCDASFETFDAVIVKPTLFEPFQGFAGAITVRDRGDTVDLWADSDNDGVLGPGDEAAEYTDERLGALVPLNDDDDDGDGVPDVEGAGGFEDDDLLPIRISGLSGSGVSFRLDSLGGGGSVRLWSDAQKSAEVLLPYEWTGLTAPVTIYAEGIDWALDRVTLHLSRQADIGGGVAEVTAADTLALYAAPTGVGLAETMTPSARPLAFVQGLPLGTEVTVTTTSSGQAVGDSTFVVSAPVQAFLAPGTASDIALGAEIGVTVRADGGAIEVASAPGDVVSGLAHSISITSEAPGEPWVADGVSTRIVEVSVRDSLRHSVAAGLPVTLRGGGDVLDGGVPAAAEETDDDGVARFTVQAPVVGSLLLHASTGVALSDTVRFAPEPLSLELTAYTPQVDVHYATPGMVGLQTNAVPGTPVVWTVSNAAGGEPTEMSGQVEPGGLVFFQFPTDGARVGLSVVTATVGAATVATTIEMTSSAPLSVEVEYGVLAGDASSDGVYTETGAWDVPAGLQSPDGPWTPLGPTVPWSVEEEYAAQTPVTIQGAPNATYAVSLVDPVQEPLLLLSGLDAGEITVGPDGRGTFTVQSTGQFAPGQFREEIDLSVTLVGGGSPPNVWASGDIGAGAAPGSWDIYQGTHVVLGGGDIGGTSDAFHFARQAFPETGSITTQVTYADGAEDDLLAGLMVRASLDADAPYALVALSKLGAHLDARPTTGAAAAREAESLGAAAPTWLRLERSGTAVSASTSPDGLTWTALGTVDVPGLGTDSVQVGLAVSAGSMDPSAYAFANFESVDIAAGAPASASVQGASALASDDDPVTFRIYLAPSTEIAYYIDWLKGTLGGDPETAVGYREYLEASRTGLVHAGVFALVKNYLRYQSTIWQWDRFTPELLQYEDVNVTESVAQLLNVTAYYIENFGDVAIEYAPELAPYILAIQEVLGLEEIYEQAAYIAAIGSFTDDSYFGRRLGAEWLRCASTLGAVLLRCETSLKEVTSFTQDVGERPGYVYYGGLAIDDPLSFEHAMTAQLGMGEELADAINNAVLGVDPDPQDVTVPLASVPGGGVQLAMDDREGLDYVLGKRFFEVLASTPDLRDDLNASDAEEQSVTTLAYAIEDGRLDVETLKSLFGAGQLFDPATWRGEAYTIEYLVEDLAAVAAAASDTEALTALNGTLEGAAREMNLTSPKLGHMYEVVSGAWFVRNESADFLRVGWQPPRGMSVSVLKKDGSTYVRNIGEGDVDLLLSDGLYEVKSGQASIGGLKHEKVYRQMGLANHMGLTTMGLVSPWLDERSLPGAAPQVLESARNALEEAQNLAVPQGSLPLQQIEYRFIPLTGR